MSDDIEQRLAAIEQRLAQLEAHLDRNLTPPKAPSPTAEATPIPSQAAEPPSLTPQATPAIATATPATATPTAATPTVITPTATPSPAAAPFPVTQILGWGGATALVLAAAYLIRLAILDGWLTPTRQIALALLAGLGLIWAGIRLKGADREYASLLPAGGLVILFLAIYGAHLYYDLITVQVAGVTVMLTCIGALALCNEFKTQLYAFFAVIGSYSAPFLLDSGGGRIVDLVIYFSAWTVVFSLFAIRLRSRGVYLVALYLALMGFELLRGAIAPQAWIAALIFQFLQLITFSGCAVRYATRHGEPMSPGAALLHAPALLIFYVLQYNLLARHLPSFAPWIAVLSAAILLLAYQIARQALKSNLTGSRWLLSAYCALVLLHAGYWESVPDSLGPWVALGAIVLSVCYLSWQRQPGWGNGPIGWVIGAIFVGNYWRLLADFELALVPAPRLLLILYALQLYTGYYLLRKEQVLAPYSPLLIYAGHAAAMGAAVQILSNPFIISLVWGLLALGCLLLALQMKNKPLGQSSLLIFALSALKVLGWDLAEASPVIRIGCLVALGLSLYLGGWLYRQIEQLE